MTQLVFRFYVMPIVEIDASSLEIHHSFLIDSYRMDFNIILWNEDLKAAAVKDLERLYTHRDLRNNEFLVSKDKLTLNTNQIQVSFRRSRFKFRKEPSGK